MGILVHFTDLSTLSVILFIIGIILLIIEMTIPGFGIAGISGIALLVIDIIISAKTIIQGLWLSFAIFLILMIMFVIFLILASHGKLPKKIILKEKTDKISGFSSSSDNQELLNKTGVAVSELRPAGIARFADKRCDVVSKGEFIEKGSPVRVVEVEGSRVVVIKIEEEAK